MMDAASAMILLFLLLFSDPAQFQARMQQGVAALDRGDLRAAHDSFQAATKLNQENAAAWMMLAQTLARQNDVQAARQAAAKAETLGSADPKILQALANFYAGVVPDLLKAAQLGERYAAKVPDDPMAWRKVAALYLDLGRTVEAISAARRGLPRDNSAELHTILGRAFASQKDWRTAQAEFTSAIRLNPYDEESRFGLAQTYLIQQDFPHAASILEDAKKIFAGSPQIELALGVAYYGQRKFEQAVGQFLRTMQIAPDVPQPYVFLGRILEHATGNLPEITERFAFFEKRNPASDIGYMLHAKALIAQLPPSGFPAEAEQAQTLLEKALTLREQSAETHYLLGILLERQRDFSSAAAHLERSIQLNGNESAVHFRLARVYDRLGRHDEAQRERALHEKLSEAENAAPSPELGK